MAITDAPSRLIPRARSAEERRTPGHSNIDMAAVRLWLLTRLAVFATVSVGAWMVTSPGHLTRPTSWSQRWDIWDSHAFVEIAHWGYSGDPVHPPSIPLHAFFPGLPLLMRGVHGYTGIPYIWAGLLISFVAGGVATVSLARIAALEVRTDADRAALAGRTVQLFLLAPVAIFLTAAYTEPLFLAFALPAWLAAKRGDWTRAALLAAGASAVRITGLFLAVALVVEFLTARDGRRRWTAVPVLAVPVLPVLGYFAYLHQRTGDWMRWQHAQRDGWHRVFSWPWDGLKHAASGVTSGQFTTDWAFAFRAEIIAVAVGLGLLVWLARRRRWAELVFVGLQLAALTTSYWWESIARSSLTWWPLWIALAAWSLRRPAVHHWLLAVFAPLMIAYAVAFTNGRWAG